MVLYARGIRFRFELFDDAERSTPIAQIDWPKWPRLGPRMPLKDDATRPVPESPSDAIVQLRGRTLRIAGEPVENGTNAAHWRYRMAEAGREVTRAMIDVGPGMFPRSVTRILTDGQWLTLRAAGRWVRFPWTLSSGSAEAGTLRATGGFSIARRSFEIDGPRLPETVAILAFYLAIDRTYR
jgi:hypothetical protein